MASRQLLVARTLVLGSWFINFGCQLYGMVAKPNMKDVADANHYAFSPDPRFIGAFFTFQTFIQLYWISKFFTFSGTPTFKPKITLPPTTNGKLASSSAKDVVPYQVTREPEPAMMAYAPSYAIGNICIALWMVFWMNKQFVLSQVCVTINTATQLYSVFVLLAPGTSFELSNNNVITHVVAKTFAGIGVLDFFDNMAVAAKYPAPPAVWVTVLTVLAFVLLALMYRPARDPTFGFCLIYDLAGLVVGQPDFQWRSTLGIITVVVTAIVLFRFHLDVWGQRSQEAVLVNEDD